MGELWAWLLCHITYVSLVAFLCLFESRVLVWKLPPRADLCATATATNTHTHLCPYLPLFVSPFFLLLLRFVSLLLPPCFFLPNNHQGPVRCLDAGGPWLVSGGQDDQLHIYDGKVGVGGDCCWGDVVLLMVLCCGLVLYVVWCG